MLSRPRRAAERPAQRLGPAAGAGRGARGDLALPRLVADRVAGRQARPDHSAPRADRPGAARGGALSAMGPRDDFLLLSLTRDGRLASPHAIRCAPAAPAARPRTASSSATAGSTIWSRRARARSGSSRISTRRSGRWGIAWSRSGSRFTGRRSPSRTWRPRAAPLVRSLPGGARRRSVNWARRQPGLLARLIPPLCEAEVPLGPEEELELDALLRLARDGARRGGVTLAPLHALSLLAHEAAGGAGGRAARPRAPGARLSASFGGRAPRLHLDRPFLRRQARDAPRCSGACAPRVWCCSWPPSPPSRSRRRCRARSARASTAASSPSGWSEAASSPCAPTTTGRSARSTPR